MARPKSPREDATSAAAEVAATSGHHGRLAFPAIPAARWGLEPSLPSRAGAGPGPEVTCRDRRRGEASVVAQAGWYCDGGRRRGDGGGDSVPGLGVRPR